ncbi:hypothetical protein BDR26DRAFT_956598 [Obelidium mucronatum]|nr:hypothetical protein BDR26DRAFT_956598 [Obelidium mucronatum]
MPKFDDLLKPVAQAKRVQPADFGEFSDWDQQLRNSGGFQIVLHEPLNTSTIQKNTSGQGRLPEDDNLYYFVATALVFGWNCSDSNHSDPTSLSLSPSQEEGVLVKVTGVLTTLRHNLKTALAELAPFPIRLKEAIAVIFKEDPHRNAVEEERADQVRMLMFEGLKTLYDIEEATAGSADQLTPSLNMSTNSGTSSGSGSGSGSGGSGSGSGSGSSGSSGGSGGSGGSSGGSGSSGSGDSGGSGGSGSSSGSTLFPPALEHDDDDKISFSCFTNL